MVSLSPSLAATVLFKTETLSLHLAQPRRAFTMWAHNLSSHTTLSILYHIKWLQNKIIIQLFLSKPLCPCSHVPRIFSLLLGMLQPSFKNSSNVTSSRNLPKYRWIELVTHFVFIAYHTMQNLHISKSFTRPLHASFFCPQYLYIWHRVVQ